MRRYIQILFLLVIGNISSSFATTWNEPWADKVIKEASSFVLAKIISSDPAKGIKIEIIKTLGGKELQGTLLVNGFYALQICSTSGGHGPEFHVQPIDSCYFFLNQNSKGQFCIATPTTGFDYVLDGKVKATFRHSYHQASVPVAVYEKAMTAIYNNYHNVAYDKDFIRKFVIENLSKSPAGFQDNEINTFFLQHVALECVYHLKLDVDETLLLPFLNDYDNFHNQISAARAMSVINTEKGKATLLKVIADTTRRGFVRVMCIWSLASSKPIELKRQLKQLEEVASDENDGFGGNLMDPRICTYVPTVKKALVELLEKL